MKARPHHVAKSLSKLRSQVVTDEQTSERMKGIRRAGTGPELVVRSILSSLGARYRWSNRDLPGSPDLANRTRGWAIFVHGCFWHGHQGCPAAKLPASNAPFWAAKIADNVERDRRKAKELRAKGLHVLVVWECQTKHARHRASLVRRLLALTLRN